MKKIEQIETTDFDRENSDYNYQPKLTQKLDELDRDLDQNLINEIVLWKVNRFAEISLETLDLINRIKKTDSEINIELTKEILRHLLNEKGIRIAMASTILRFKNPRIYQIIDQRVYRFIFSNELNYPENNFERQIDIYIDYLQRLKQICETKFIEFEKADRILYTMDKRYNSEHKLKY